MVVVQVPVLGLVVMVVVVRDDVVVADDVLLLVDAVAVCGRWSPCSRCAWGRS